MAKTFRRLQIEKVDYSANTLRTRDIFKSVYKYLQLILKVTHTNGASPSITAESLCKLINKISLTINGQDTILSIPFYHLYYMNWYESQREPSKSLYTTASSQGTSTISLILPFAMMRAVRPNDTLLDLRKVSTAVLGVDWGTSIGSGVSSIDSAELQIYTGEYSNVQEAEPLARHEMSHITTTISATGAKQIDLEVGANNQYKALWLYVRDSGGSLSDSVIDKIELESRGFHFVDVSAEAVKWDNALAFGMSPQTGVYVIEAITDGELSKRLDARALHELILKLNSKVSSGSVEVVKEKAIYK